MVFFVLALLYVGSGNRSALFVIFVYGVGSLYICPELSFHTFSDSNKLNKTHLDLNLVMHYEVWISFFYLFFLFYFHSPPFSSDVFFFLLLASHKDGKLFTNFPWQTKCRDRQNQKKKNPEKFRSFFFFVLLRNQPTNEHCLPYQNGPMFRIVMTYCNCSTIIKFQTNPIISAYFFTKCVCVCMRFFFCWWYLMEHIVKFMSYINACVNVNEFPAGRIFFSRISLILFFFCSKERNKKWNKAKYQKQVSYFASLLSFFLFFCTIVCRGWKKQKSDENVRKVMRRKSHNSMSNGMHKMRTLFGIEMLLPLK